jgi:nucleoside triphosphate diphosphatase
MQPSKDISRLIEIMAALRNRDTGCAWDVEQTFQSIAPYTIEEAYEVAEAIARGDMADLCDELGDLLLQVVFHARMAEEARHFGFGDVVEAVTRKMIRRHPHVFGDASERSSKLAKGAWERIKAEEKAERRAREDRAAMALPHTGLLDEVPRALPAFLEARKLQATAARVGFDWSEAAPILDKIEEEVRELRHAMTTRDAADIASEWGDLAFALVNLSRHLEIDPEMRLKDANAKFRRRFAAVERGLAARGTSPSAASLGEMEKEWVRAKRIERGQDPDDEG